LATTYSLVRVYSGSQYEVEVGYEIPGAIGGSWGGEWQVAIHGALASEHTVTEIQTDKDIRAGKIPRVVGPWRYHRKYIPKAEWERETNDDGTPNPDGKLIDPNPPDAKKYPNDNEGEVLHFRAGAYELWLETLESDRGRIQIGMDYGRGICNVTCSKQTKFTIDAAAIAPYQGAVNREPLSISSGSGRTYNFAAGILLFDSYEATEEIGAASVGHLVTLNFTLDTRGHQYWAGHTYEDTEGTTWPVYSTSDNRQISETFTRQLGRDFSGLLSLVK
jgi:hypothetical protein